MKSKLLKLLTLLFLPFTVVLSQGLTEYGSGMKVKLNDDGSKYFRFITWHQFWLQANENNSGSLKYGEESSSSLDRPSTFSGSALCSAQYAISNSHTLRPE
jgi:hypothetical protein